MPHDEARVARVKEWVASAQAVCVGSSVPPQLLLSVLWPGWSWLRGGMSWGGRLAAVKDRHCARQLCGFPPASTTHHLLFKSLGLHQE